MRKSALAHFRQLCCLGLGGPAVMPSLLAAMHELIPSQTNSFFWADAAGRLAGFMPEYVIPDVVATLLDPSDGLVDCTLPIDFATAMRRGLPVGNLLAVFDERFYRSPLYHLICRPYDIHHAIDAVVRDAPDGLGKGAFVLGRAARQPAFGAAERATLHRLLPYLAHALHERDDPAPADFTDSGECGLAILDRSGRVTHLSARARHLLYLATGTAGPPATEPRSEPAALAAQALQRVCTNLVRVFEQRDAAPPAVVEQRNAHGRFAFRAHWLEPAEAGAAGGSLIVVTVQHQEPAALVMMRKMHAAGLSQRQKDVALLLGRNLSFDAIGAQLHISRATAKDYAQRLYRKIGVHTREELLQRVR